MPLKLRTAVGLAKHVPEITAALAGMRNQSIGEIDQQLRLSAEWLLMSQCKVEGRGYAASFSLINGWSGPYVETTGYIVPTMIDLSAVLNDGRYRESALKAGQWLLAQQRPSGAFLGIDSDWEQPFDTGQVLLGLIRLWKETRDQQYFDAAEHACRWLVTIQQNDGSWLTGEGFPRTYLSRTAAALLAFGILVDNQKFVNSANRFLDWAANEQRFNGSFANSQLFEPDDPVLHTIVYVLEGFLMAWQVSGEERWLNVALKGAEPLKEINNRRDLILASNYCSDWHSTRSEKCIPGLAQWAGLAFELYDAKKDVGFLESGAVSLYYVQSKQLRFGRNLKGALPSSIPFWGAYQPYAYCNWTVKFFVDALLHYRRFAIPTHFQQELFVRQSHRLQTDGGGWERDSRTISEGTERLMAIVEKSIEQYASQHDSDSLDVLDLGCGTGRLLRWLRARQPNWKVWGLDPVAEASDGVRTGSAYSISFDDNSLDAVYAFIVLQHVGDLSLAMREIRRVLKPGGMLIVVDRNSHSSRGVLKSWHEIRGRWFYAWDAPFRERWYSAGQWRKILKSGGFGQIKTQVVNFPGQTLLKKMFPPNSLIVVSGTVVHD